MAAVKAKRSNSVGSIKGALPWVRENFAFFRMRKRGRGNEGDALMGVLVYTDEYARRYESITGRQFSQARIFEVGYGARPNLLLALVSLGYDAKGIDLDRPILRGSPSEFAALYQNSGLKRLAKSFVRYVFFDRNERNALGRALQTRGKEVVIDDVRFLVGDACSFRFPAESIDFVYSHDVLEHISRDSLHALCKNLSEAISIDGLAVFDVAPYTGIAGGHLVEWYPHTLHPEMKRRSEPWEHLRKRRFRADCYLNELRVIEYKEMFATYFTLIDTTNEQPGLGRDYLTPAVREELAVFSEEELLSHRWTFVLRRKHTA